MIRKIQQLAIPLLLLLAATPILKAQSSPSLLVVYDDYSGKRTGLTYWKNGETIQLTDGTTYAGASAIAMSGNDVYVAGYQNNLAGEPVATYWKNKEAIKLSDGKTYAKANGISISGPDVHVIGNDGSQAVYWKNGAATSFGEGTKLYALSVSGNDVYIAGCRANDQGEYVATYWKNGNEKALTDGKKSAEANAIAISGNDVYVAGFTIDSAGREIAMYWKNGKPVVLPDGCRANAIAISGNDIYVAGIDRNEAGANIVVCWKNGTAVRLTSGNEAAGAGVKVITVAGNDVYLAGYLDGIATYWKNEKPVSLNDITGGITGMVVR
ncbi:hypothetical protein [Chitinophaga sp. CF418]|uniref:hypothetical protein n=1 Tax=Chitinophaga sp. CF418 TaxID=1855287 RepID=UPI00091E83AB|nr:hypothetical protein [Chitinophaga sp. CF418]SHN46143.1 hypothetical protein SAMN05216311_12334 [Chitinophaga sp. CF418]